MKFTWRSQPISSPEQEQQDLEKLKTLIDAAISDGKVTQQELKEIRIAALADGKVTPEECSLISSLILEQVKLGNLKLE
jgi:hypothetical protein